MTNELVGSDLARAMLKRGDAQVWCAVSNDSKQHAIKTIRDIDEDHLMHIVSFENGCFLCKEKSTWKYAIPIEKVVLTQIEVGL